MAGDITEAPTAPRNTYPLGVSRPDLELVDLPMGGSEAVGAYSRQGLCSRSLATGLAVSLEATEPYRKLSLKTSGSRAGASPTDGRAKRNRVFIRGLLL
jgi:hypothetical protein